jgi:hypothetical protein
MKKWFDGQLGILRNNIEFRPVTGRQEHAFVHVRDRGRLPFFSISRLPVAVDA